MIQIIHTYSMPLEWKQSIVQLGWCEQTWMQIEEFPFVLLEKLSSNIDLIIYIDTFFSKTRSTFLGLISNDEKINKSDKKFHITFYNNIPGQNSTKISGSIWPGPNSIMELTCYSKKSRLAKLCEKLPSLSRAKI